MEDFMKSITCENDLEYYEKNLCNMSCEKNMMKKENNFENTLCNYLVMHKGKLVKVEMTIGGCNKSKIGILMGIGKDYIVLKTGNAPVSAMIPLNQILCINIVHDNNRNRISGI